MENAGYTLDEGEDNSFNQDEPAYSMRPIKDEPEDSSFDQDEPAYSMYPIKMEPELNIPYEGDTYMVRTRGGKRTSTEAFLPSRPGPSTAADPGPSTSQESRSKISRNEEYTVKRVYTSDELFQILQEDGDFGDVESDEDGFENIENIDFQLGQESGPEDDKEADEVPQTPPCNPSNTTQRQWTRQAPNLPGIPFSQPPGVRIELERLETPRDFLDQTLTDELLQHIVRETNIYADVLGSAVTKPRALIKSWKPLGMEEFRLFLGLLLHMGTIPLSRISDYWNTDPVLFGLPSFRRVMSRNRFFGILQSLHFAKNPEPGEPIPTDPLYKIKPMIDIFHKTMDGLIFPTKNLTIDESMVLWRGRLIFGQYIKNKAHPCGIKIYMLTEASGLVLRFIIYAGGSDTEVGGKDHASKVVHKLMEGKLGVGHALFMDNFYNSVNLVHELLEKDTYVTGTLRKNRKGNPLEATECRLRRGEAVDYYTDEGVCVLKWKDKRDVLMISSEFSGRMVDCTTRRGVEIQKPEMVLKYNESMGGVDHYDQMMSYYPIQKKSLKWTKKMGIHIIQLCVYNAYKIYNKCRPIISLYDFRNAVVRSLLPPNLQSPPISRPLQSPTRRGLPIHFPEYIPSVEGKKQARKRCQVCLPKKIRKESPVMCPACPGNPPLCLIPCFAEYHKEMVM